MKIPKDQSAIHWMIIVVGVILTIFFLATNIKSGSGINKPSSVITGVELQTISKPEPPKMRVYRLELHPFDVVLDTTWQKVEIGWSAKEYGYSMDFFYPEPGDSVEVRLGESQKILRKKFSETRDLRFGKSRHIYVRGKGIYRCKTFNPFASN